MLKTVIGNRTFGDMLEEALGGEISPEEYYSLALPMISNAIHTKPQADTESVIASILAMAKLKLIPSPEKDFTHFTLYKQRRTYGQIRAIPIITIPGILELLGRKCSRVIYGTVCENDKLRVLVGYKGRIQHLRGEPGKPIEHYCAAEKDDWLYFSSCSAESSGIKRPMTDILYQVFGASIATEINCNREIAKHEIQMAQDQTQDQDIPF
jgi:hypothetical protein